MAAVDSGTRRNDFLLSRVIGRAVAYNRKLNNRDLEVTMRKFEVFGAVLAISMALLACGGPEEPPPPLDIEVEAGPTKVPDALAESRPGELGDGWYVQSNSSAGTMILNFDRDDASIWITIDSSASGQDLQGAVDRHRRDFEQDPIGEHLGEGTTDTAGFGPALWSWGRMADEETTDELVLFVEHPNREAVLALRTTFPKVDDISTKLEELVTVADAVAPHLSQK